MYVKNCLYMNNHAEHICTIYLCFSNNICFLFPEHSANHTEKVNNFHEVLTQNPIKIQKPKQTASSGYILYLCIYPCRL